MSFFEKQLAYLRLERDILDQKIRGLESLIQDESDKKNIRSTNICSEVKPIQPSTNELLENFIRDKVIVDSTGRITKREVVGEFNLWFYLLYGPTKSPKTKEIYEYFEHRFGKYIITSKPYNIIGWSGYRIQYEPDSYIDSDGEITPD